MSSNTQLATDASASAELTDALSDLIRVIQFRDRDRACCFGLTVSQCYGLRAICDDPACCVNDLAARLYLEKSTASRLINGLVEAGLAQKEQDPADLRVSVLTATPRGESVNQSIKDELAAEFDGLLEDLDPRAQQAVVTTVRRLATSMAGRVDAGGGSCCVVR